ncbi:hypothetical protein MN116_007712 [Schistosoma mekongi]|uniref:Uncharacterized protein n=1 Tax=Schistosoma mekongi TaxID=38744 RepID=A0AAE1Z728_SCHME|nr:hypothetical protein MN116_007712 [Schistosoma mekongi]
MKSPTDSGQTSKNISPLPISHTISDVLLSPKFQSKQMIYRLNQQYKTHRSTSSTLPSPLLQHIPEMLNSNNYHSNSHQLHYQQCNNNLHNLTTMSTTAITKYPTNSFVEPKTNMASLTYSPRSRHPCRLQNKIIDSFKPVNKDNVNLSNTSSSSIQSKSTLITTSNRNTFLMQQNRQIGNNSPPPLPPPPKHLIYMLGGDSSIYSTPHGSPQQSIARKLMSFNSTTPTTTNNNNISQSRINTICNDGIVVNLIMLHVFTVLQKLPSEFQETMGKVTSYSARFALKPTILKVFWKPKAADSLDSIRNPPVCGQFELKYFTF